MMNPMMQDITLFMFNKHLSGIDNDNCRLELD